MSRVVEKGVHAARPPYGLRPIMEIKDGKLETRWELDPVEAPIDRQMYKVDPIIKTARGLN